MARAWPACTALGAVAALRLDAAAGLASLLYPLRMVYPLWSYFPSYVRPLPWAVSFVDVVQGAEDKISMVERKTGLDSDAVLSEPGPGLLALGYVVESGRIHRPVLFGENGTAAVNYEIDPFHDELCVAVEVEAGRGAEGFDGALLVGY